MTDKQMISLEALDHITAVTEALSSFRKLLEHLEADEEKYKFQIALYNGTTTWGQEIDRRLLQEALEAGAEYFIKELISLGFRPSSLNENEEGDE